MCYVIFFRQCINKHDIIYVYTCGECRRTEQKKSQHKKQCYTYIYSKLATLQNIENSGMLFDKCRMKKKKKKEKSSFRNWIFGKHLSLFFLLLLLPHHFIYRRLVWIFDLSLPQTWFSNIGLKSIAINFAEFRLFMRPFGRRFIDIIIIIVLIINIYCLIA